jgi:hypothetical protein
MLTGRDNEDRFGRSTSSGTDIVPILNSVWTELPSSSLAPERHEVRGESEIWVSRLWMNRIRPDWVAAEGGPERPPSREALRRAKRREEGNTKGPHRA